MHEAVALFLLTSHAAEQADRYLPDSACSGSDANDRTGLAIQY
jgi:hypothetical protein